MEEFNELTEYSGEVIEFPSTWKAEKLKKILNSSIQTEPMPVNENKISQTNEIKSVQIQTDMEFKSLKQNINEHGLAAWLKKIYPLIDSELNQGITPIYDQNIISDDFEDLSILPYQKLTVEDPIFDGSTINLKQQLTGLAVWLSVKTSNAPNLVVAATPTIHSAFCEHLNPAIKIFTPKRLELQNFIAFSEFKTVKLKTCIKSLQTNKFNKDMFAGGTVSGDLHIWQLTTSLEIEELFSESTEYGCIMSLEWLTPQILLCCYENGIITMWKMASPKKTIKDREFKIIQKDDTTTLTTILALTSNEFLVGSTIGKLFYCSISTNRTIDKKFYDPIIGYLESHKFAITSLIKTSLSGTEVVLSCDLSGEVNFHDVRTSEDGPYLIVKMPLPYKNSIAISKNGNLIFSPGIDGSLDVFRINRGTHFSTTGYENGKGNFVKVSDNGLWIITGIYNGIFQIFKVE